MSNQDKGKQQENSGGIIAAIINFLKNMMKK